MHVGQSHECVLTHLLSSSLPIFLGCPCSLSFLSSPSFQWELTQHVVPSFGTELVDDGPETGGIDEWASGVAGVWAEL